MDAAAAAVVGDVAAGVIGVDDVAVGAAVFFNAAMCFCCKDCCFRRCSFVCCFCTLVMSSRGNLSEYAVAVGAGAACRDDAAEC